MTRFLTVTVKAKFRDAVTLPEFEFMSLSHLVFFVSLVAVFSILNMPAMKAILPVGVTP